MKAIDMLNKTIQQEIDRHNAGMEYATHLPVNLISEMYPQGYWVYGWLKEFEFSLPYAFALIEDVKEAMKVQFPDWEMSHERQHVWDQSKEAGHFLTYKCKGYYFDFAFRTSKEGSTCVLNKIGDKTVPIYEVVCSQNAAAEFGVE